MGKGLELKKGTKYKISFNDCCVTGDLMGTFLDYIDYDEQPCSPDDEDFNLYVFDIGRLGYKYYYFTFEEVNDSNND